MPLRLLPVLLFLFVGSGCAALIYEIVWFQLLELVIGASTLSLAVLLGTYMGGMCLGSLLFPKLRTRNPLRAYGWIEIAIGIFGLAILIGVPQLNRLYAALAVGGTPGVALRAVVAVLCLLAPTLCMGASLPAIARGVKASPQGISWLGYFYGGNIFGAVVGSLVAGFYLLRFFDMAIATYVAVAINFMVGLIALALARYGEEAAPSDPRPAPSAANPWPVYLTIALSGACALGAEVIWTRLLSLMMGATVYTFSIILAVFLTGLGIGSSVGAWWARRASQRVLQPRIALALCQFILAIMAAWAAYVISTLIPNPAFDPTVPKNPLDVFRMDLVRAIWAVLPASLFWGASFPLALASFSKREPVMSTTVEELAVEAAPEPTPDCDASSLVGSTYAANTVGGILGTLLFSLLLIPWLGTQHSQQVLIALSAVAACMMLWHTMIEAKTKIAAIVSAAILTIMLMITVRPVPWLALAYGRRMNQFTDTAGKPLYIGEGVNSSIVVSELTNGQRYFHVSGKVEATTEPFDMRLQRMLGHISALFHKDPKSVLVVGFGAGVTAGSFTVHPSVEHITISEIEPLIPPASTRYFAKENYDVLHDPRTRVYYDDARHFILTSKEKYDVITSDPIHPWVKGTSTLYSKEYFELCKAHLKPGGIVTQWIPLYESDFDTVKSELATFFQVFPHATIWNSDASNQGYDTVVVGQLDPQPIDVDALEARLRRPDHARVAASLAEVQINGAIDLLTTYAGRDDDLKQWLGGAQINRDLNLRLQYLAGWGLNFNRADVIYSSMVARRQFSHELFKGSPNQVEVVQVLLEAHSH